MNIQQIWNRKQIQLEAKSKNKRYYNTSSSRKNIRVWQQAVIARYLERLLFLRFSEVSNG